MSTLHSPNYTASTSSYNCCFASSSSSSSSSSSLFVHYRRIGVPSVSTTYDQKKVSLQYRNVVRMQDGAVAASAPLKTKELKRLKDELLSVKYPAECKDSTGFGSKEESTVSITVVGASGDLAKKKIFPALFALFYEDCLPKVFFSLTFFLS
uniref:Glucose-6-phosphate dehydrogenase NAD-binding domain-containing protein n=1 Tax=Nelumbo nucifera TaxID=4432 RepID=A0A822YTT2_NELNU|nr:TPA_asm: hypothetical protein HUJ06_004826 [Nelumbo nucifera]